MRNTLAVVVLAWIPLCWQPLRGQPPTVGIKPSGNQQKQPNRTSSNAAPEQRGTQESPLVVDTKGHKNTKEEAAEEEREKDNKEFTDRWAFYATVAVAGFTGVLVIIGALGIRAANRTLKAIEKQATLQAASMTQWVSIAHWKVNLIERASPVSERPKKLGVCFDINNESNFPLVMQAVFRFGSLPNSQQRRTVNNITLFPGQPYTMNSWLNITEDQAEDYVGITKLRIAVHGQITHVGIAKEQSPLMTIRGHLVCGKDVTVSRLENESIRLIGGYPTSKLGLFRRFRNWRTGHSPKGDDQTEGPI